MPKLLPQRGLQSTFLQVLDVKSALAWPPDVSVPGCHSVWCHCTRLRSHLPICSLTTKIDDTSISVVAGGDCQPVIILFVLSGQYLHKKTQLAVVLSHLVTAEHMQSLFPPTQGLRRWGGRCISPLGQLERVPAATGESDSRLKSASLRLP